MIITGNKSTNLAKEIYNLYPDAVFCSRNTGYDLTINADQDKFSNECLNHEVIIINSALWKFNQTILLDKVYKKCVEHSHRPHIITIGSTTDRVKNSKPWLYNAEKKALRDYSNTLSLGGVWDDKPKVTYISFGTISNNQEKHPDRKCLDINSAAHYIKWVIDQPKNISINEISIDPLQINYKEF